MGEESDSQVQLKGEEIRARFDRTIQNYRGLHHALAPDSRLFSFESILINLKEGHEEPNLGLGAIVADFRAPIPHRDSAGFDSSSPWFITRVEFIDRQRNRHLVDEEVVGKWDPNGPTKLSSPKFPLRGEWDESNFTTVEEKLDELLPRADETFNLLLEAACDRDLNPLLAEKAQSYRNILQVAE